MLLDFINNALQKYFNSDTEIADGLNEFTGQHLVLSLTDLKKQFLVSPQNTTIVVSYYKDDGFDEVLPGAENKSDDITTTIHANIITLLRLALGADYQSMLNDGSLRIDGDAQYANQLRSIFMNIEVDWEEVASKYVGDSFAYQLGNFARRFTSYKKRSVENFRLDVSEYLQEESRISPTKTEVERFLDDVDTLDADVERIEARMRRLDDACNANQDSQSRK